ncbi:hypothetical protein M378DRAFT_864275 [Amanita muscaria Koide BX008]|uniref:Protein kinase domain-containing protein n=1 Tax=Amanita muscaria (strain Koide BX008) TaxID=946122 RepID=A0A0C2SDU1_AMAMK|nr:hypothetical protein M378DRAFT_864275 [Amanita muscaria Koide BX008]
MLEVAKSIQYFHSMDSEFHARFRFLGLTARYVTLTPHFDIGPYYLSYEANVFLFGCLFYEICFDVKIGHDDRVDYNSDAVAKRPSRPEIRDDEWQLIQRCCAREPKSRPTMDDIVREMEAWDITYIA